MFSKTLVSVAIASAAIAFGANALACSTIIVGKDVSKTGTVIIGHNEDNGGRIIAQQHWVPAQTHKAGEMINLPLKFLRQKKRSASIGLKPFHRQELPSLTALSMKKA